MTTTPAPKIVHPSAAELSAIATRALAGMNNPDAPRSNAAQLHDLYDAATNDHDQFIVLADHCGSCGQTLPEVTG